MRTCCAGFVASTGPVAFLLLLVCGSLVAKDWFHHETSTPRPKPFWFAEGLRLSAVESVLLQKRLSTIQNAMRKQMRQQMFEQNGSVQKTSDLVVIFPGAGGVDELSMELEDSIRRFDQTEHDSPRWITTIDWKEHRGSIATAAYDSEAVGEAIGQWIWEEAFADEKDKAQLRSVHSIGISVGGFAASSLVDYLDQQRQPSMSSSEKAPLHLRLTLLDPFCSRGVTGVGYGARYFGRTADYAEHYLNTDDPVPSTNEPLPLCFTVDVTGASQRNSFALPEGESMHCWPVAYYARFGYRDETSVTSTTLQKLKMVGLPVHSETRQRGSVQVKD